MSISVHSGQDQSHPRSWFGLHQPFDPEYRIVTSGYLQPRVLLAVRVSFATFCIVACIINAVYEARIGTPPWGYLVLFTHLSFIGVTSYFCAASFHTLFFLLSLRRLTLQEVKQAPWYPLQKWGRVLQALHLWLFSTTATFPIVTTVIWWSLLRGKGAFATQLSAWSNVSMHTLNSVLIIIEISISRMSLYWGYLPLSLITLGLYLSLAYLSHYLHGRYPYPFLNPVSQGSGRVGTLLGGMLAGYCVLFVVIWAVTKLRDWFFPRGRGVRVVEVPKEAVIVTP